MPKSKNKTSHYFKNLPKIKILTQIKKYKNLLKGVKFAKMNLNNIIIMKQKALAQKSCNSLNQMEILQILLELKMIISYSCQLLLAHSLK